MSPEIYCPQCGTCLLDEDETKNPAAVWMAVCPICGWEAPKDNIPIDVTKIDAYWVDVEAPAEDRRA